MLSPVGTLILAEIYFKGGKETVQRDRSHGEYISIRNKAFIKRFDLGCLKLRKFTISVKNDAMVDVHGYDVNTYAFRCVLF